MYSTVCSISPEAATHMVLILRSLSLFCSALFLLNLITISTTTTTKTSTKTTSNTPTIAAPPPLDSSALSDICINRVFNAFFAALHNFLVSFIAHLASSEHDLSGALRPLRAFFQEQARSNFNHYVMVQRVRASANAHAHNYMHD